LRALPHIEILRSGPLLKIGATIAALLCAGSAALAGPGGPGSPADAAPVLDHYLCVPGFALDCRSVAVTLSDGTTVTVGDPNARLDCDRVWWGHRSRHQNDGETVEVTNELSPPGADSPTSVALVTGRLRWNCALTTPAPVTARFGRGSPRIAPTTLARFACFGVEYPSRDAVQFTTPSGLRVGDYLRVDVRRPAVLCVPSESATGAAERGANALVCFETRVRARWWGPLLCVPSGTDGTPPVGSPTSTTDPSTTTTTESTTTTTTESPTTTTTTTTTQPCPGVVIDGVCVIDL
jgi:hypothetical protein